MEFGKKPKENSNRYVGTYIGCFSEMPSVRPSHLKCKHGDGSCEICGTSERTDIVHTTKKGKGVVGDLLTKNKIKK